MSRSQQSIVADLRQLVANRERSCATDEQELAEAEKSGNAEDIEFCKGWIKRSRDRLDAARAQLAAQEAKLAQDGMPEQPQALHEIEPEPAEATVKPKRPRGRPKKAASIDPPPLADIDPMAKLRIWQEGFHAGAEDARLDAKEFGTGFVVRAVHFIVGFGACGFLWLSLGH